MLRLRYVVVHQSVPVVAREAEMLGYEGDARFVRGVFLNGECPEQFYTRCEAVD